VILLGALVVVSVFGQVVAAALRTMMRYNRLYHEKVLLVNLAVCLGGPFHTSSVKMSPLPVLQIFKVRNDS
jgi:hypothetical protein